MNLQRFKNIISDIVAYFFLIAGIVFTIAGCVYTCQRDLSKTSNTSFPVEDKNIDSLKVVNNKIVIEVEHLDSIKDAKVIEVKSLDNDSTLKLFYKLISE